MSHHVNLSADVVLPRLMRVRQRFQETPVLDLAERLRAQFAQSGVLSTLKPGGRVGVAVGSRGITGLATVVGEILGLLRGAGAQPFLIPAMGSHGGGTAEGQKQILSDYGITEGTLGVEIEASMDVRSVGRTGTGIEVCCAAAALRADAIVLVNRVKPHTDFGGEIGSGLLKMAVVGLGKHAGAGIFHRAAHRWGYLEALRAMGQTMFRHVPIVCGVGLIENARHETAQIAVVPVGVLIEREPELAAEAGRLMARLPFDDIDLLIVDRLGKNITGTGMDPNVIGRMIHGYSLLENEQKTKPVIRRIFVRDLTPETHGNATGIGMADFTTERLVRQIDRQSTYTNALTAMSLQGSKIPIYFASDRECLLQALRSLPLPDPARLRVVRIQDTLSLERLQISEGLQEELAERPDLEVDGPLTAMAFDGSDNLTDHTELTG